MQKVSKKENKNAFVTLVLQEPFHMSKYRNVILFNFISILCWLQQILYTPCTREKAAWEHRTERYPWSQETGPQQATCIITSIN